MPEYRVREVLAERKIVFCGDDVTEVECIVRIGLPEERSDHDWICPYEIAVGSDRKSFGVYGVDSIQAIVLALKTLDAEIKIRAEELNMEPTWLDEDFRSLLDPRDVARI